MRYGAEVIKLAANEERKRDIILNFSQNGDRVVIFYQERREKNKAYQLRQVRVPLCVQILLVLEIDPWSLSLGVLKPIVIERRLFQRYYPKKIVKGVDFIKESCKDLLLLFDDEILFLNFKKSKIEQYFRISLCSGFDESVYQGFYQGYYVFSRSVENSTNKFKLRDVEFLEKSEIFDAVEDLMCKYDSFDSDLNLDGEGATELKEKLLFSDD